MFAIYQGVNARHDLRAHDRSLFVDSIFDDQILPCRLPMGAPSLSARMDEGKYFIGRIGIKLEVMVESAFISVSLLSVHTILGIV